MANRDLKAEYIVGSRTGASVEAAKRPKPQATRVEPTLNLTAGALPAEVTGKTSLRARSGKAFLTPPETGDYLLGMKASGFSRRARGQ